MLEVSPETVNTSKGKQMTEKKIVEKPYCTIWNCTNKASAAQFSTTLELPYCSKTCRERAEYIERFATRASRS